MKKHNFYAGPSILNNYSFDILALNQIILCI